MYIAVFCSVAALVVWLSSIVAVMYFAHRLRRKWLGCLGILVGHAGILVAALLLIVSTHPLASTGPFSTADKIAISESVDRARADGFYQFSLDQGQVARSVRTGSDLLGYQVHSEVALGDEGQWSARAAVGIPWRRYVNVQATGKLAVQEGKVDLELDQLKVGRISLPRPLRTLAGRFAIDAMQAHSYTTHALQAVRRAEIVDGRLELDVNRKMNLARRLVQHRQSEDDSETIAAARQAAVRWLDATAASETLTFQGATADLFRFVQEAHPDWEPVRQNRAALIAGGIALGHPRVADLAGWPLERDVQASLRNRLQDVTLRGRNDWVRHFWVSAALVVLTNATVSDAAGLFKEEGDSGPRGSGFSFSDLQAARAGVLLAQAATGAPTVARQLQRAIAGQWAVDDMFPPASDLPEGISEDDLDLLYGGVDGPGYQQMMVEIERRLAGCALLQIR